jgi:hypothetical protein
VSGRERQSSPKKNLQNPEKYLRIFLISAAEVFPSPGLAVAWISSEVGS